ncbi:2-amino-4-hydroxy-6-hydroxymethyldihydropteridine diphosphokinase [Shewanella violacea]|uniref:2-amino-4-hydroxy-6-hydroxymethyldihydropteridine diphosphokinase n=1 Tax=Shewanella violacea (strain JCM 10179 / CIP 106290 / LMG 19151 / DSS12) TaxID=637905 RepID=D4ZGQ7_SHEVD|nr:2-amino-4-hydroxy-6-hydroxymethyldihydropteridine diphosphokinase [Shewanella violacea]BAJ00856.1 2-amino-4-hydroxy-6-hydroxymethyldihydropteridine pyrophosphokinase [Shewanella violacea DSS12]
MLSRVYISLGSNIEPERYLKSGLNDLSSHFGQLLLSSVYESEAVGFEGSNFLNMVVGVDTDLSISELVSLFKQIEQDNGRLVGAKKFASRTLDLDLLLYDDMATLDPVELPRAEILTNAFVLWPMAELAPDLVHPLVDISYQTLWDEYDKNQQRLWPIPFSWTQVQADEASMINSL